MGNIQYPAPAPTFNGDFVTISRFLNSPTMISKRLRQMSQFQFLSDTLMPLRWNVEGGAIGIEQDDESLFTDRAIQQVAPLGDYPLANVGRGTVVVASPVKWGQAVQISAEKIKRERMNPVNTALTKLKNTMVKHADGLTLSVVASALSQTQAASASWLADTTDIPRDIYTALATLDKLQLDINPNYLIVDPDTYVGLMANTKIQNARKREDGSNPIYTGEFPVIAGVTVLPNPNLPVAKSALLLDSTRLGGLAEEELPGDYANAGNVQVKTRPLDDVDGWRIQVRRSFVPIVIEPKAGVLITGVRP